MKLKNQDFVKIEYVGRIKSNNQIFDLTDEKLAKKEDIYNPKAKYGEMIICIGEGNILGGIDAKLVDKEIGKDYTIELNQNEAFGPKNPKLIKIFSMKQFKKHNINPYPGARLNIDGIVGAVRSVNSGRVFMDFNHPLSGKEIIYEIKIGDKVTKIEDQLDSVISFNLFMSKKDYSFKIEEDILKFSSEHEIPESLTKNFENKITKLFKGIKKVEFEKKKADSKKATT
ncbi:hypothetical protein HOD61_00395 [archaeon]|jgi:FKBP-type peptidyl-prolyl cis-trans isomerase 2|nr:hypothetical protein [archaeon]